MTLTRARCEPFPDGDNGFGSEVLHGSWMTELQNFYLLWYHQTILVQYFHLFWNLHQKMRA